MLNTPVLFLVFNRLDTTQQVFAKIREAQPRQLFIGADGARTGKEGEAENVAAVRNYILDNIDWECEVKTLFREQNLGCGKAVSQAITWFFDNVEQGIILEDDTLPDISFFRFCEELLDYYKDDEKIMHITGANFQKNKKRGEASYYFSKYPHIWGWATWAKSWKKYNYTIPPYTFQTFKDFFELYEETEDVALYWHTTYEKVKSGLETGTWDYQWMYTIWANNGYAITSNTNLILNLGINQNATHTKNVSPTFSNDKLLSIPSPLLHTKKRKINMEADTYLIKGLMYSKTTLMNQIRNIAYKKFPKLWNFLKKLKKI